MANVEEERKFSVGIRFSDGHFLDLVDMDGSTQMSALVPLVRSRLHIPVYNYVHLGYERPGPIDGEPDEVRFAPTTTVAQAFDVIMKVSFSFSLYNF